MTTINTSIFKAYDVRGLYPSEVNEEAARVSVLPVVQDCPVGAVDGAQGLRPVVECLGLRHDPRGSFF